jgi:hypothetical protein
MALKICSRSNSTSHRRSNYPVIELLEDRCVPDASGIVLPPGQNVFQYANTVLQGLESYRIQANNAINGLVAQQINQLSQNLSSADQIAQSLLATVVQDKAQFSTDGANGASIQTQIADLAKIQTDGLAAGAGISLIAQYRQAAIQQTIQQLQVDAQLRFAVDQMVFQTETNFLNQLLPAITAAEAAISAAGPQVGTPLAAGQSANYTGTFTSVVSTSGFTSNFSTNISVTVTVGGDGMTLTGPASAAVTTSNVITNTPVTMNSTSGSVGGSLLSPNGTAAKGAFTLAFPSPTGTEIGPWVGFLGSNQFVGQITDPTSGILTSFVLTRVM